MHLRIIASEDVTDIDASRRLSIRYKIAQAAGGVPVDAIALTVTSASIQIDAAITLPSQQEASSTLTTLASSSMDTESGASSLLDLTVSGKPAMRIVEAREVRLNPPPSPPMPLDPPSPPHRPPPSAPAPLTMSNDVLMTSIGGGFASLFLICLTFCHLFCRLTDADVLAPAAIGGRGVDATEKKKVYRLLQTKGGRQATTNAARATHNHRSYHSDPFPEAPDFAVPSHLGRALR